MEEMVKRKKHVNGTNVKVSAGRNKQKQVEDKGWEREENLVLYDGVVG